MKYSKRLAHRVIEGQAFVLETDRKVLHAFDQVATRIWQLAGSGATRDDMAQSLCREFDVTLERAKDDTAEFLKRLAAMGLLEEG